MNPDAPLDLKGCYYELLGISRDASDVDIKKAYRKQALKYHPDKNAGDTVAEAVFKAIGNAYATLSDPQEKAYYDEHREDILFGFDSEEGSEGVMHVPNLWPFFSASAFDDFEESERGFFAVYGAIFKELCENERRRGGSTDVAPSFGGSGDEESVVENFYSHWTNFTSQLSFAWKDIYDSRLAPNRDVRRAMEKDNKKERAAAKKKYVEQVRALARFCRQRDPRMQSIVRRRQAEREAQAEAQIELARLKELEASRAKLAWKEERARLAVEEEERLLAERVFRIADEMHESRGMHSADASEFECEVCDKSFKSEKSYLNHEQSKKHQVALARLRAELMMEDEEEAEEGEGEAVVDLPVDSLAEDPVAHSNPSSSLASDLSKVHISSLASHARPDHHDEEEDEPITAEAGSAHVGKKERQLARREKRKAKSAGKLGKSAIKAGLAGKGSEDVCFTCSEEFDSRTKLFAHLEATGHAAREEIGGKKANRKKRT